MTEQDHEMLSQYLDGELGAPEVLNLERRLIEEPLLQAQLEQLKAVDTAMKSAFSVPGAGTVPPRITRMLQKKPSNVVAFPDRRRAGWGFAIAASLMAASGLLFFDQSRQGTEDYLPADDLLVQELEFSPSRSDGWDLLADGRQVRPILSFQSRSGGWCREYMLAKQGEHWRGVACRGDQGWVTEVISLAGTAVVADSNNEYRPAGANDAYAVEKFVEANADGIALSASQEAELIKNGWK